MTPLRVHLAPGLTSLTTLGVGDPEAWLSDAEPAVPHAEEIPSTDPAARRFRLPLPGTPLHAGGALSGRPAGPGGAGTGWIVVEAWRRAPLAPLLAARFSHPRSASRAERVWNLLCHLRTHGVGTPQPLAVVARGDGLVSRDSMLVTREVGEAETLVEWAERERDPAARRRGLQALGASLASLIEAGVELPHLRSRGVRLVSARAHAEGHAHDAGDGDVGDGDAGCHDGLPGLRVERLPGVLLMDVGGGRMRGALEPRVVGRLVRRLGEEVSLSDADGRRLLAVALQRCPGPWRRSVLRSLAGGTRAGAPR